MSESNDLKDFETSTGDLPANVQSDLESTEKAISDELKRSRGRFFISFSLLSVIGYFCSLSVCSQNSIALTQLSLNVAAHLHQLPDPWCPIVCGIVFSILPILFLFIWLDRFQLRRLIVQFWWLPVLTTLLSCLLMSVLPAAFQHDGMHASHNGIRNTHGDVIWLMWWTLSAMAIPLVIAGLGKIKMSSSLVLLGHVSKSRRGH